MKKTAVALIAALTSIMMLNGCTPHGHLTEPTASAGQQAATQTLLADANAAMNNNDFHQAEMHVERAVRIEPRNPYLWHTLAKIKIQQGKYDEAVNFCLKSNSLIADNALLKKENLLLMALAYHQMGEYDKAEDAQQQAAEMENTR